ncbi:MAG: quinolinate synthase A [Melioribacteraceae bacterium]|nr:MAG: quinolinate synthase A [Melioribacteraceae bacterium]
MENRQWMIDEILRMKKEKNAVILAHNYQIPEIQDIADFVGDSLGLSQVAGKTEADVIVFCGVHFMAETASIISPNKKVLIPDLEAGCSLASSITGEQVAEWKKQHPDAVVVSYINTTADVKAQSDYCVTSSNAVKVVEAIPADKKILFLPDKFLGSYAKTVTGRDMEIWDGACHVHEKIGNLELDKAKEKHPKAEILIHPECGCSTSCMVKSLQFGGDEDIKIFSTEGMINHVENSESDEFLIATEVGILHRMKKANPTKEFHPASEESVCEYMKMITLENLYSALKEEQYEVKVPEELAERAKLPIQRMLEIV